MIGRNASCHGLMGSSKRKPRLIAYLGSYLRKREERCRLSHNSIALDVPQAPSTKLDLKSLAIVAQRGSFSMSTSSARFSFIHFW